MKIVVFVWSGIVFLLISCAFVFAYEPLLVNNLMVSETVGSCEAGRVFFLRSGYCTSTGYPNEFDVCTRYEDEGKTRDYEDHWVGTVTGLNWPANEANAQYNTLPYEQAMDRPADPDEPCINHVKFVQGTGAFKRKGFSYFVYDMTDKRGCQVVSATLRFKASPWYSEAAQNGNATVHIGLYDMDHTCENLTNDGKRTCFGNLVNDPANNPLQVQFPHSWTDYKHYAMDVKDSVQADLTDVGGSGYVGFMIGSRNFGENDIDYAPGMRNFGITEVVLEVELGPCVALPTVSNVNPASGPASGGTGVTITGTNFVDGATVTFGGVSGTGVTFQNAGTLTATTPSHAAGPVDVSVINPDGGSGALTDGFRYNALPTVTGVNPASGVVSGGTVVTITGTNFVDGATVTFGGVSGTGVTFQNASTLTATTPSHAAGQVDVTVTNPDGSSAVLNDGFVYNQTNNRLYVSIGGNCHDKTPCYNSIRDAMNDAETGDIILIAEGTYDELITLDKSISVTLQGGWDSSFKPTTRKTILNNAPKVSGGGALTLQELTVSPPE